MTRAKYILCYIALLGLAALPRLAAAGPNADAEIFIGQEGLFCGLAANSTVEFSISARNMSQVRQVLFKFSWEPAHAIAAVAAALGQTTKAHSFVAIPPIVKDQTADWGSATLGGSAIAGEGHLADMTFTLSDSISSTTPIDIYLDVVSLGPSSTERDFIRPQVALLRNYCDAEGQALPEGIFFRWAEPNHSFSAAGTGGVADGSDGEVRVSARLLLQAGAFRVGAAFTWDLTNTGPGPAYAFANDEAILIPAGATEQVTTTSDERGRTHLLLDAEQETALVFTTCAEGSCAESQVEWGIATSISEPSGLALPRELFLAPNYPNPFNASTAIPFALPEGGPHFAQIDIFNLMGQKVATPFAANTPPGRHVVHWNSQSATGAPAASGLYIYRLRTDSAERHRAMLLLR